MVVELKLLVADRSLQLTWAAVKIGALCRNAAMFSQSFNELNASVLIQTDANEALLDCSFHRFHSGVKSFYNLSQQAEFADEAAKTTEL